MDMLNCWEVAGCGRQEGGSKVGELGVCSASIDTSSDGLNRGKNAARICWTVAGTLCKGEVQGTQAQKEVTCLSCNFFRLVKTEEGKSFRLFASMKGSVHA